MVVDAEVLHVVLNAYVQQIFLPFILYDKYLAVIVSLVVFAQVLVLQPLQWYVNLQTKVLPEFMLKLASKMLILLEQLAEVWLANCETFQICTRLVHEIESSIVANVEAADCGEHPETATVKFNIVYLVSNFVIAVLDEENFHAFVHFGCNQRILFVKSNL